MSDVIVLPEELAQKLQDAVGDELDGVKEEIAESLMEAGTKALTDLRHTPAGAGKFRSWRQFNRGWTAEARDGKFDGDEFTVVIYNKRKPHLTHLLEYGHEMFVRDASGRYRSTGTRTKAFHMLADATVTAQEYLERKYGKD